MSNWLTSSLSNIISTTPSKQPPPSRSDPSESQSTNENTNSNTNAAAAAAAAATTSTTTMTPQKKKKTLLTIQTDSWTAHDDDTQPLEEDDEIIEIDSFSSAVVSTTIGQDDVEPNNTSNNHMHSVSQSPSCSSSVSSGIMQQRSEDTHQDNNNYNNASTHSLSNLRHDVGCLVTKETDTTDPDQQDITDPETSTLVTQFSDDTAHERLDQMLQTFDILSKASKQEHNDDEKEKQRPNTKKNEKKQKKTVDAADGVPTSGKMRDTPKALQDMVTKFDLLQTETIQEIAIPSPIQDQQPAATGESVRGSCSIHHTQINEYEVEDQGTGSGTSPSSFNGSSGSSSGMLGDIEQFRSASTHEDHDQQQQQQPTHQQATVTKLLEGRIVALLDQVAALQNQNDVYQSQLHVQHEQEVQDMYHDPFADPFAAAASTAGGSSSGGFNTNSFGTNNTTTDSNSNTTDIEGEDAGSNKEENNNTTATTATSNNNSDDVHREVTELRITKQALQVEVEAGRVSQETLQQQLRSVEAQNQQKFEYLSDLSQELGEATVREKSLRTELEACRVRLEGYALGASMMSAEAAAAAVAGAEQHQDLTHPDDANTNSAMDTSFDSTGTSGGGITESIKQRISSSSALFFDHTKVPSSPARSSTSDVATALVISQRQNEALTAHNEELDHQNKKLKRQCCDLEEKYGLVAPTGPSATNHGKQLYSRYLEMKSSFSSQAVILDDVQEQNMVLSRRIEGLETDLVEAQKQQRQQQQPGEEESSGAGGINPPTMRSPRFAPSFDEGSLTGTPRSRIISKAQGETLIMLVKDLEVKITDYREMEQQHTILHSEYERSISNLKKQNDGLKTLERQHQINHSDSKSKISTLTKENERLTNENERLTTSEIDLMRRLDTFKDAKAMETVITGYQEMEQHHTILHRNYETTIGKLVKENEGLKTSDPKRNDNDLDLLEAAPSACTTAMTGTATAISGGDTDANGNTESPTTPSLSTTVKPSNEPSNDEEVTKLRQELQTCMEQLELRITVEKSLDLRKALQISKKQMEAASGESSELLDEMQQLLDSNQKDLEQERIKFKELESKYNVLVQVAKDSNEDEQTKSIDAEQKKTDEQAAKMEQLSITNISLELQMTRDKHRMEEMNSTVVSFKNQIQQMKVELDHKSNRIAKSEERVRKKHEKAMELAAYNKSLCDGMQQLKGHLATINAEASRTEEIFGITKTQLNIEREKVEQFEVSNASLQTELDVLKTSVEAFVGETNDESNGRSSSDHMTLSASLAASKKEFQMERILREKLSEEKSDLEALLDSTKIDLETQIQTEKERNSRLDEEITALQNNVDSLKLVVAVATVRLNTMDLVESKESSRIQGVLDKTDMLLSAERTKVDELSTVRSSMKYELESAKDKIEELSTSNTALTAQVEELRQNASKDSHESQRQFLELEKLLSTTQEELNEEERQVESLYSKIDKLEMQIGNHEKNKKDLESVLSDVKEETETVRAKKSQLDTLLTKQNVEIIELTTKLEGLEKNKTDITNHSETVAEKLTKANQELQKQIESLSCDSKIASVANREMTVTVAALKEERDSLKEEKDTLTSLTESLQNEQKVLADAYATREAVAAEVSVTKEALSVENSKMITAISDLNSKKEEMTKLESKYSELLNQYECTKSKLGGDADLIKSLQIEIIFINEEKEALLKRVSTLARRDEIQKASLDTSNEEIDKLMTTIDSYKDRFLSLAEQVKNKQTEIVEKDEMYEHLQKLQQESDERQSRENEIKSKMVLTLTKHEASWKQEREVLIERIKKKEEEMESYEKNASQNGDAHNADNDGSAEKIQKENSMMKELLTKSQMAIAEAKKMQQTLSKEIDTAANRENQMRKEISVLKNHNQDMVKRLDDQEKELDEFEHDFEMARDDARKVVEELRSQLLQFERQNQQLMADGNVGKVEDLKNKLRQMIQQNKRLHSEIEYSKKSRRAEV